MKKTRWQEALEATRRAIAKMYREQELDPNCIPAEIESALTEMAVYWGISVDRDDYKEKVIIPANKPTCWWIAHTSLGKDDMRIIYFESREDLELYFRSNTSAQGAAIYRSDDQGGGMVDPFNQE